MEVLLGNGLSAGGSLAPGAASAGREGKYFLATASLATASLATASSYVQDF
ncbi:MAG TPA: hypothetical protein VG276_12890 [Actinomycetes bacterium]|jgi:hypothetical protein|nr:hypothetical protein [Actinomycetes bacterium]